MKQKDLLIHIGNTIKELRIEHGFSQEELGKKLNLSKQAISNYESGRRDPGQDNLFKFAEIFSVSISDFFPSKEGHKLKEEKETYKTFDQDALEILEMLEDNRELKILFKKTGKLSDKEKEQIVRILKATLPPNHDE